MRIKHAWHAVPVNRENLGHPPAGTTIDLYIALKPAQKGALVDALYEVNSPGNPGTSEMVVAFGRVSISRDALYVKSFTGFCLGFSNWNAHSGIVTNRYRAPRIKSNKLF